jgi:hypothetical protein
MHEVTQGRDQTGRFSCVVFHLSQFPQFPTIAQHTNSYVIKYAYDWLIARNISVPLVVD